MRWIVFSALSAAMAGCATAPPAAGPPGAAARTEQALAGREVAEARCARCHAIGLDGESPAPQAPPFRALSERYRIDVLQEELISGLHVGVAEMPTFNLTIEEADALGAYLRSIQDQSAP